MLTAEKYTLLIPTYNRPAMLAALLGYFSHKNVKFPIVILDSSSSENKEKNRALLAGCRLDIRHLEFEQDARFDFKIESGLKKIKSDYVSLCADDDIAFVEAIEACVEELDRDQDLVGCHGTYLNFSFGSSAVRLRIEYDSRSIESSDPVERACQLLVNYEALNYGVFRYETLMEIVRTVSDVPPTMFWELYSCLVPLVGGKMRRIPHIYHARRSNDGPGIIEFHPATWIAKDPEEFIEAFSGYREKLFKFFDAKGVRIGSEARRAILQSHFIYLCRELKDGESIKQAIAGATPLIAALPNTEPLRMANNKLSRSSSSLSPIRRLVHKLRYILSDDYVTEFSARESRDVRFKSTRKVRALLPDNVIDGLSRLCGGATN